MRILSEHNQGILSERYRTIPSLSWYCILSWEKETRMIYRARFSMAVSSWARCGCRRRPESGMPPVGKHGDQLLVIFPLARSILKTLCRKIASSFFSSRGGATRNMPLPVEAAIRHQDMAVGIESKEVAKGLDGDNGAGDGIILLQGHRLRRKSFRDSQAQRLRSERSFRS